MSELEIKKISFIPVKRLVDDPSLIKVMVIKAKHLDQIKEERAKEVKRETKMNKVLVPCLDAPDTEIIGRSYAFVIVKYPTGRLVKVHNIDYLMWVRSRLEEQGLTYKEAMDKLDEEKPLEQIPQIFEE